MALPTATCRTCLQRKERQSVSVLYRGEAVSTGISTQHGFFLLAGMLAYCVLVSVFMAKSKKACGICAVRGEVLRWMDEILHHL